jgi:hypothetical protein
MKEKFHIAGIKKILLTWHKHADLLDTPDPADPARALYGPPPKTAAGERGRSLVDFFKQVFLFEDLPHADLRRLALIVHERTYRDGEYIFEEGKPGTALYLVRGGRRCPLCYWSRPPPSKSWRLRGQMWFTGPRPGLAALSLWWPSAILTSMPSVVTFQFSRIKFLRIWLTSSP